MLRTRVIPALLVHEGRLVKTTRFGRFAYVGDPCNTVRIFNELEVDELMLLDIAPRRRARGPDLRLVADIADEAFMPVAYGGAIRSLEDARAVLSLGIEKVVVNSEFAARPEVVTQIAGTFGSQAIIGSVDYRVQRGGRRTAFCDSGRTRTGWTAAELALRLTEAGAGEILATCIDREGTWDGLDLEGLRAISDAVSVPVIAHGGIGTLRHLREAVVQGGASAIAVGSMVVFQKRGNGVLVNFPDPRQLGQVLPGS